ncbi:hypothetical protein K501DRAFT_257217 [Backusella circina FSU 941]|nr:hypothetical protein K501DRAFT_257217 [Backusella circina FSU 941]
MSEEVDLVTDLGCIIEPWTCGYLETNKECTYKTNREKYSEERDSILLDNQTGVSASKLILGRYSEWAAALMNQPKGEMYLLNEQFIVKPPRSSRQSQFVWHRDSDYYEQMNLQEEPTIACWTALDAVDQTNGTVVIGSLSDKNTTKVVTAPAGSVLFMSSKLFHHSTGNSSDKFRRAYMPQYSIRPLVYPNKGGIPLSQQCVGLAVKCLE